MRPRPACSRERPTSSPLRDRGPGSWLASLLLVLSLAGCGSEEQRGAGPAETRAPVASTPAPDRRIGSFLRYAVLGDSYSNGQSVSAAAAWPEVMARELTEEGLATAVVANPSVTGATTAEMLKVGIGPIRAARPDVMTVMLGVNDQVQGRTVEQFAADEDRALQAAIDITGSPERVLAVDIPDYSVSPTGARFGAPAQISEQIDAFNAVVRRVAARRKVRFVSIVDLSRTVGSGGISSDGLHPSETQLADWADRIAQAASRGWRGVKPATR